LASIFGVNSGSLCAYFTHSYCTLYCLGLYAVWATKGPVDTGHRLVMARPHWRNCRRKRQQCRLCGRGFKV